MWEFPSFQQLLASESATIGMMVLLALFGAVAWAAYFWRGDLPAADRRAWPHAVIGTVLLLAALLAGWSLAAANRAANACRHLDLSRVTALEMQKMPAKGTPDAPVYVYRNAAGIQSALRLLRAAGQRSPKRGERLTGGLRLRLVLDDAPGEIYLDYFAVTDKGSPADSVSVGCAGTASLGDFTSPGFGQWLRENFGENFEQLQ